MRFESAKANDSELKGGGRELEAEFISPIKALKGTFTYRAVGGLMADVRRSQRAPIQAHWGTAFQIPKKDGGTRLASGMCKFWSCWFRGLDGRGEQPVPTPYEFGF